MVKLRHSLILALNLLVLLLVFGCAPQTHQAISTETAADDAIKQAEPLQAEEPSVQQAPSTENAEAKQKIAFARSRFSMAQKGLMGYSQMVVLCRDVIRDYPDTSYEREARELLRQVPEDQRSQFKITNEELGL